jgi:periplasmic copper chaperone A
MIGTTAHRRPRALATAVLLLALGGAAQAHDYAAGPLTIGHPWSRATPNGAKVAGGYLTVTNTGTEPDRLTGAAFGQAGRAELHSMSTENGVMKMAPVEGGLAIKPGETLTLAPGGYHLMFLDLKAPLKQGDAVAGSLTFEKTGTVPVSFEVEAIAARAPGGEAKNHGAMPHDHGHKH